MLTSFRLSSSELQGVGARYTKGILYHCAEHATVSDELQRYDNNSKNCYVNWLALCDFFARLKNYKTQLASSMLALVSQHLRVNLPKELRTSPAKDADTLKDIVCIKIACLMMLNPKSLADSNSIANLHLWLGGILLAHLRKEQPMNDGQGDNIKWSIDDKHNASLFCTHLYLHPDGAISPAQSEIHCNVHLLSPLGANTGELSAALFTRRVINKPKRLLAAAILAVIHLTSPTNYEPLTMDAMEAFLATLPKAEQDLHEKALNTLCHKMLPTRSF